MELSKGLAAAAVGVALFAAGAAWAGDGSVHPPNYMFPDGAQGFALLTRGGPINPGVLVGFNPQPDPPGDTPIPSIDLSNAFAPVITNPAFGPGFTFVFSLIGLGGDPIEIDLPDAPNADGRTGVTRTIGDHRVDVGFFFGPDPVDPGSWVGFNPQPEPPGDFIGGSLNFDTAADPFMGFTLTIDDHRLEFVLPDRGVDSGVPEPEAWALMILGFAGTGAALRERRRLLADV